MRAISFEIDKSFFLVNINNNTSKDVNDCECQIAKMNTAIFVWRRETPLLYVYFLFHLRMLGKDKQAATLLK